MSLISANLLSTLSLDLLAIEKVRPDTWWNFRQVNSPFSRLYLIDGGEAFVRHHGQTWRLTAGILHLIPCFVPCDYFCHAPFDLYYIAFTARLSGGHDLFTTGAFDLSLSAGPESRDVFDRLLRLNPNMALTDYDPYKPGSQIFAKKPSNLDAADAAAFLESTGQLRQLLARFVRTMQPAPAHQSKNANRFAPALNLIEENLHRPIALNEMAALTGISPVYFSDLFHRVFGERPTVFINRRRIEKAQLLLLATDRQIQEIASMCGFRSAPYFTRTFCALTGETPTAYRRGHPSL